MGVSIMMTPGPVGRNFGKQISITPGWRSQAAAILRENFGEAPFTLTERDTPLLETMARGASIYTDDTENMWRIIVDAIEEHSAVTILMEY